MPVEHTPGPWKWWTSNSWRRLKRDDRGISQNVLEPFVCPDGHPDISISQADMALIEAAPDLLEVILATRNLVSEAATTGFNCHDGDWAERLFANQARLSAAIAKATGGQ